MSKYYITGRVNVIDDIEKTEDDIVYLLDEVAPEECEFIVCREHNKKCGLPTHLHYHFLVVVESEPDKVRAKLRKHLTDVGYVKHHASCKVTEDPEKALYYTLKQQDLFFTNMDDEYVKLAFQQSSQYNSDLTINSWSDHLELILKLYSTEFKDGDGIVTYSREDILEFIHGYIINWNNTAKKEHKISFNVLHPTKIVTLFHQCESQLLDVEDAFSFLKLDCTLPLNGIKKIKKV